MYRSRSFNLMMFPQHEILFLLSRPALVPARYSPGFAFPTMQALRKGVANGLRSLAGTTSAGATTQNTTIMDDAVASAEGEDDEALLVDAEPISPRAATASPSHSPELPAADAEAHQAGKDESKRGKASDCCALCTEAFTPWGSSLNLSSFVRKAAPRRSKHNCRICARPVCEIEPSREGAETTGCCRKTRVPKRLWHRSLASLRKEDTKVRRQDCELCARTRANGEPDDCSALHSPSPTDPLDADASKDSLGASVAADTASCICAEGWLCNDCEENVSNFKRASPLDDMQAAADAGDLQALHVCASLPLVKWMLTLDCEESDDAQHFAGCVQSRDCVHNTSTSGATVEDEILTFTW